VRLSHLTNTEKRAYILADNKLAQKAGWDREILAIELQTLTGEGFEVELTGFDTSEIDIILDEAAEAEEEKPGAEDAVPERLAGPPVTQPGDLWILGKHRLMCADAREDASYSTLLQGEKATFVFTDPPYNVAIDGHAGGNGRIHHRDFAMASGEMSQQEFTAFLKTVFSRLAVHTTDGSIHQICMDWRHLAEMMTAGNAVFTELKYVCVWAKRNAGMGSFYRSRHELIFVWKNGNGAHINNFELGQHGRSRTNVWEYAGISSAGHGRLEDLSMHPTVKPVALVADAIKDCSHHGALVLDAFCGSGSTLIAAERTGRKARALEIDPGFVDVAVRRWQSFTGKSAILEGTDETFEEVSEKRTAQAAAA
jgi:DNA modification methylase